MTRHLSPRRTAAFGAVLVFALAGCADAEPTLLDESDFEGVEEVDHNDIGDIAPGWWLRCIHDDVLIWEGPSVRGHDTATSWFSLGDAGRAGATLIDGTTVHVSADENIQGIEQNAQKCADSEETGRGYVIEEHTDLDADAVGWHTESPEGFRGEFVLIKLDNWRFLTVGFWTYQPTDPIDLDELIRLAREGAAQFEGDTA